jgi:hypothetical protein
MGQSIIKNIRRVFAQNGGSGGGGVAGSGTTNYIPKWTPDGFTLGDSQMYQIADGIYMPRYIGIDYYLIFHYKLLKP